MKTHTISQQNLLLRAIAVAKKVKSWNIINSQANNHQADALKCKIMQRRTFLTLKFLSLADSFSTWKSFFL